MLTGLGRPRKDSEHSLGSCAADNRAWGSSMQEAKPRLQRPNSIRRVQWKCCVLDALLGLAALCCLGIAQGKCEYGALPGTMVPSPEDGYQWQVYDQTCQLKALVDLYLGLEDPVDSVDQSIMDVSMLILGDSVDRATTWDVNDTAQSGGSKGLQSLLNEHWRVALSLPHLEIVYQFAPGSHIVGPYHDDVPWNMTIANALPAGFALHELLTGREKPNVVVFSNMLWDLGRWLFLSEIAEPERMDHFGKPLLREQEYLPLELLDEWRQDTVLQMRRIERRVDGDALLIYHNGAFAKMVNCTNGTQHMHKGMGKRTHLVQLNALARQIIAENPRWHMVDLGSMSESFLSGNHLRDEHHPRREILLQILNIYLNLQQEFGTEPHSVTRAKGDVARWDAEYTAHSDVEEKRNMAETEAEERRLADELKSRRELEEQRQLVGLRHHRSQLYKGYKMLTKLTVG